MAVNSERLFSEVAPYIQDFERVEEIVKGLDGLDESDALERLEEMFPLVEGTLRTDLKIIVGKLR